ncbi:MAG: imidazole glycerol phosphate synthase subunit HisF [Omnitrophica WOR_2 bacterium RIFCSPLOWO2_02_FULL_50_19]|nr:MAG: imidazole glycerol phosphate synthase subunit HisF [Omnitrophica WOR_2 bacterium RIFCSPLOWO2_02_FULL_50_19]
MPHNIRIIPRLDIKGPNLVKGIHLEGIRVLGKPEDFARNYYKAGADELIYMDVVASLYNRNNLFHLIEKACEEIFIPLTMGGGLRTISDIEKALRAGADKVAINTQAIKTPNFIKEASRIFGSQCIVGSVEAKRKGDSWEAYIDSGREPTGVNVLEWVKQMEDLGAGEILLTSVDQEGTKKGFDIDLMKKVADRVSIPVIASGGAGSPEQINDLIQQSGVNAVAVASILHYNISSIPGIKDCLNRNRVEVRM